MTVVDLGRWPAPWAIAEAPTHLARGRGLLGRRGLGEREGLWLPVRSVHTVGMRFALDLVWLDRDGGALRLDTAVGRRRVRTCLKAGGGVVEVAAGSGAALVVALEAAKGPDGVARTSTAGPRPTPRPTPGPRPGSA